MRRKLGFRRLKAKHKKKFYKNDRAYIEAIYRNNKNYIDERMGEGYRVSHKTAFINTVKDYMKEQRIGASTAISRFISSEEFTTKGERLHHNLIEGLMGNKEAYKIFKNKTGIKKKTDIDMNKLEYDYNDNIYKYEDVIIDVANSPLTINVY